MWKDGRWANGYEEGSTTVRESISWVGIKLPERKIAGAYRIKGYSQEAYPKEWIFQGSNDGTVWNDLHVKESGNELAGGYTEGIYYIENPEYYQFYRIYITQYAKYLLIKKVEIVEIKIK